MAVIIGTTNNDLLNGTPDDDIIRALEGDDTIYGHEGDDLIDPGTGSHDTVDGGDGFDTLDLSDYDQAFVFASGSGGTASTIDGEDNVSFDNVEKIIGTSIETAEDGGADIIFLANADHGYTVDAGAGLDFVFTSPFADTITLGTDQGDAVRALSLADIDGDVITDWDNSDSLVIAGLALDASNVTQTSTSTETVLEIDADKDGVVDATVTLLGDYTDGSFEFFDAFGPTYIIWNSNTGETLDGGPGQNIFRGSLGEDTYNGLGDDDVLYGDAGNDTLNGGDGNDRLSGEGGSDTLSGGAGTDRFISFSPEEFDGDTITDLEVGEQLIFWDAEIDQGAITLTPGATEATLSADVDGDGTDDFVLTLQGDFSDRGFIVGENFDGATLTLVNVLRGGNGRSTTIGTEEQEIIETGNGKGAADGAGGDDLIRGGAGPQTLMGGAGNDQLFGGKSNDILDGGTGEDRLTGGPGNDTLTGGEDSDVFIFTERDGRDTITDFEDGSDIIDLSDFGYSDISELTLSQHGADAQIQLLGGASITLENVHISNLDNSDFNFGA